jgi:transcriptional regulator with XRE-family HTH domain
MADLAALLTSAAARDALARRDITEVFRILRDAGVSQVSIAAATGQRQSEVSEIVSGRQVQSVALLERIAEGLGVPRGWMGLAYGPDSAPEPAAPQDAPTEHEIRANLIRHGTTVMFGRPVFDSAAPIRAKDVPTPVPRRIGPAAVGHVAVTTERLGRLIGDFGGIPVTDALTAHTRASEALLGATMRAPVRQQLLVALSDAHRAAGSAAVSAGLRDLACQHFVRDMDCASAGGDLRRAVLSLGRLGMLELRAGQPNEALKFFQLGAATAPTRLTRAVLEYHCAWALGLLDGAADALRELRRAAESFAAGRDEPRPWEHFATDLPHIEGCTYFALGRFDRAAVALSAAVEGMSHAMVCTMSNSGLLAAAQLRCGELRSGLSTATRVVGLARDLRSVWVRDGLAPLQQAAAARRESTCQDLARELAILRRAA